MLTSQRPERWRWDLTPCKTPAFPPEAQRFRKACAMCVPIDMREATQKAGGRVKPSLDLILSSVGI